MSYYGPLSYRNLGRVFPRNSLRKPWKTKSTSKLYQNTFQYTGNGGGVSGGSAISNYPLSFDIEIEWNVRGILEVSTDINWNTGSLPLRWYRVQGVCNFPTAAGDGLAISGEDEWVEGEPVPQKGGCSVMGIETDDTKCAGALGKQQFIQNILAQGLSDLCRQLNESKLNWEIHSIKRWSRVFGSNDEDDKCNRLEEIPFKDIPECIEFNIQNGYSTDIGVQSHLIELISEHIGIAEITISGSAIVYSPNDSGLAVFSYESEGGDLELSGEAITSSSFQTDFINEIGATSYVDRIEAAFGEAKESIPIIPSTLSINTKCGLCNDMPSKLYLFHNIDKDNILLNYMKRNGLELPNPFNMYYSSRLQSWIANHHLSGISDDNLGSKEDWRFSFEWSCLDQFIEEDLSPFWKFSMLIVRKNLVSNLDSDTRLLITFPPEGICTKNSEEFDFSFNYNTRTNFVRNGLNLVPNLTLLNDNIGVFSSKFWSKNPNILLRMSSDVRDFNIERQNIISIFPSVRESLLV